MLGSMGRTSVDIGPYIQLPRMSAQCHVTTKEVMVQASVPLAVMNRLKDGKTLNLSYSQAHTDTHIHLSNHMFSHAHSTLYFIKRG